MAGTISPPGPPTDGKMKVTIGYMGVPAAHAEDAILNLFATLDGAMLDDEEQKVRVTTTNVPGGFPRLFEEFLKQSRQQYGGVVWEGG